MKLPSWKELEHSLLLRMGGAIAAIALLGLLGMSVSGLVAESTQGSGKAINQAGSLRMQSWHMTSLYLSAPTSGDTADGTRLRKALATFDATLNGESIRAMLPRAGEPVLDRAYLRVRNQWLEQIRPRFEKMASGEHPAPDAAQRAELLGEVEQFVAHINTLVKQMEEATESRILIMRLVLGVTLGVTVLVGLLSLFLIHTRFVAPLRDLLALAAKFGRGDLSARTEHTGEDELGQLGRAFNLMAEDLSKLYRDLERRVEEKTAALSRSNQSLDLLYRSIARLHGAPPGREIYTALLRDIERVLELGHGVICLGERNGNSGVAIASTMEPGDSNPCEYAHCALCHDTDKARIAIDEGQRRRLTLPLANAERQYGVLILQIPDGQFVEAWQVQLLEALSRHIGVAIGAERRIEQNRRLALLEERAVIARELHDSLAQSLAYMKIQVSRIQAAVAASDPAQDPGPALAELRQGLNGAYRQLRELLSTFRLKMEGESLSSALAQTAAEFAERGELRVDLDVRLDGGALSPNEEIHVLHIVREALSNVLNHARASWARVGVRLAAGGAVEAVVEDDGVGIVRAAQVHHYGMTIMEERARTLHGTVSAERRPGGGTLVRLRFMPTSGARAPLAPPSLPAGAHPPPAPPSPPAGVRPPVATPSPLKNAAS